MQHYSVFGFNPCPALDIHLTNEDTAYIDLLFTQKLESRARAIVFELERNLYANYLDSRIVVLGNFYHNPWFLDEFRKINGLFKTAYTGLAGYAIIFKKRFYLSGQVNRLRKMKRSRLLLQIGYPHNVQVHGLNQVSFRRWRRKKFGMQMRSNNFDLFSAFIDLFRNLRRRAKYTSRGIRIKKDRFKMKFRPDHGKYGFKINY